MDTEPKKSKSKFDWLAWSCVAGVLALIALLATPPILRTNRIIVLQDAKMNARQIGLALHEFENKYGTFPNDQTKFEFDKSYVHKVYVGGTSSNALFRQLIASGIASEQIFHARIPGLIRPDGIITPGEVLKKGEVAFSYISGLSSKDDPFTPIVLTPLIPGTTKFDPKHFKGKAVVLHIDNSVRSYDINKDGHIYDDKGINLLSPKNPIWKGKAPDIRYPE
jgi:hypothetical protein